MRKALIVLSMAAAALGSAALPSTAAMAAGPSLACSIDPGNGVLSSPCETTAASLSYTITYQVSVSGSASYSWTPPGAVVSGCAATSKECVVSVPHAAGDRTHTATVVITQGSTHTTLSVGATTPAVCIDDHQPVLC